MTIANDERITYCHRWHDSAAGNVLAALEWIAVARLYADHPSTANVFIGNARDRVNLATHCGAMATEDERVYGSVFPGVP